MLMWLQHPSPGKKILVKSTSLQNSRETSEGLEKPSLPRVNKSTPLPSEKQEHSPAKLVVQGEKLRSRKSAGSLNSPWNEPPCDPKATVILIP